MIGGLVDGREYYFKDDLSDGAGGWFQLLTKKSDDPGSTVVDLTALPTDGGRSHSIVKNGQPLSGDASSYGPRSYTQPTDGLFRGVAVTASNSDDVAAFGIGLGFAGTAAVTIAGIVRTTWPPEGSVAIVETAPRLAGHVAPPLPTQLTVPSVNPAPGVAVTTTSLATPGPALATVTV